VKLKFIRRTAETLAQQILRVALVCAATGLAAQEVLPGTSALTLEGDLSEKMVSGIATFFTRETQNSTEERTGFWHRDFTSRAAYEDSVAPNREHLRRILGIVDDRLPATNLEYVSSTTNPALVSQTDSFTVHAVRWPVFERVFGEGLWLRPKGPTVARIIAIPDADQTPEMVAGLAPGLPPERQFARRLAENGCEVLVPVLVGRQDTWSGSPALKRFTNQPHREWIYRQAFEMGRHIIGYEVQKVLAAADFFKTEDPRVATQEIRIGVAGYGEGGLIALYSAALDPRIEAAVVSGYFDSRLQLAQKPIYRNVFGLLKEFGDAEIASLVAPRGLVVEYSPVPKIEGPPAARPGRTGAAPGRLTTPDYSSVEAEFERARALLKTSDPAQFDHLTLITGAEGMLTGPVSDRSMSVLLHELGAPTGDIKPPGQPPEDLRPNFDPAPREHIQIRELEDFTQRLLNDSERTRADFFWNRMGTNSPREWGTASGPFRKVFWEDVLGKLPASTIPLNARSRLLPTRTNDNEGSFTNSWTGYEVVLDVRPEVFAWGYLLLPRDLKAGERRPVVVCQHGLEGVPADVLTTDPRSPAYGYYKAFAARLAKRGFIVFAPHNPYRGGDRFRYLQRLANPLGQSLFSIIIAQHERILDWLSQQPFVDPQRIAFYGLSYGGKTAMRVPAVLDRYALSICSADFNDWVRKNAATDFPLSYMFMNEYELPEFNLGETFNYAEMAALIAPRPFMVERGHHDGVGIDEWVASEYAKVRRLYDQLGLSDRTAIEFFNGPHTINGIGSFEFLHRQLNWPAPK